MNQFGKLYSQYYDLLYSDKNYEQEAEYIYTLIQKYAPHTKTILDMGCGTGKHAEILANNEVIVHGIDLSDAMLEIAKKRTVGKKNKLSFSQSNIQELELNRTFDTVISLFHVMSYQNSNNELIKAFEVAKEHLNEEGVFIFDFWYGPAVLTDLPSTRVKRLEDKNIKVTRVAEPVLHAQKNIVDVNYDVFIEDKKSSQTIEKKELHKMRYFFDTELELICQQVGFRILKKLTWMTSNTTPNFNSWNVIWIVKK